MRNVTDQEREFSERIYKLRELNNLAEAVQVCDEAINNYNESNFFFKVKGDILYDLKEYKDAINAYMCFLDRIKNEPEYFTNFTRFFEKVSKKYRIEDTVFTKIARLISNEDFPYVIRRGLLTVLLKTFPRSEELIQKIEKCKETYTLEKIKTEYGEGRTFGRCETIIFWSNLKKDTYIKKERNVNRYILKQLETRYLYEPAIELVKKMLDYSTDLVDVRSLFRICRKRNDYTEAKELMNHRDIIHEKEFNIQYELVLFFESEGDETSRNRALKYIDELSEGKVPICRTLFKFYVKYDMLEQAKNIQDKISEYSKGISTRKKKQVNKETQEVIWDRLQALVSEQEHNRQLLAMTDLIKGFAHELGQPVTNIRYAIQLFDMKNKKEKRLIGVEEKELFESILAQTERVGKLLNRFAPITSSRSQKVFFSVRETIESVFDEMGPRLSNENIVYEISGDVNDRIYGEVLQFTQVFYNLIINAIYAINKRGSQGIIRVNQQLRNNILYIYFSDNGVGIEPELQKKIFEPFFSTKKRDVGEGGEGLGLFIVWNILKLFNGRIYVDKTYTDGAQFIIEINMEG